MRKIEAIMRPFKVGNVHEALAGANIPTGERPPTLREGRP